MKQQELIPNLFRTEFRKITAVLCRHFGIAHIEIAEDIASETFLAALNSWPYKGIPQNPTAWLYAVAKNKAINQLTREHLFRDRIAGELNYASDQKEEFQIDLTEENITDSQLQMLFTVCNPILSAPSQVALALRLLCGFGIEEIANAFLTSKETIHKRLQRAKEKLREGKVAIVFPPEVEINKRLENVLTTLYLLFNEGYYSESKDVILREDLCYEAMRLNLLLVENERTNLPPVNALMALMCFHASRFAARKDENGELILYRDQDESRWNKQLIAKGAYYLKEASTGTVLTTYHLEASIAYWHTIKEDTKEKWENILQLYNRLLQLQNSPIAALNRTFALSKVKGKDEAIREAEKLQLTGNHYYHVLLGELYRDTDPERSMEHLQLALSLAKTQSDRQTIQRKCIDNSEQ